MLRYTLILLVIFSFNSLNAQELRGPIFGMGISNLRTERQLTGVENQKYRPSLMYQIGFQGLSEAGDRGMMVYETLIQRSSSHEEYSLRLRDENNVPLAETADLVEKRFIFSTRVGLGYQYLVLEDLALRLGASAALNVFSGGYVESTIATPQLVGIYDRSFDMDEIKFFEYGLQSALDYRLSDQIHLNLKYYHGLSNVSEYETWEGNLWQLSLSLSYLVEARRFSTYR